jgi:exodeoxyribonuclease VII large subunit
LLQGERAADMMVEQLLKIFRSIERYDVVVIVRGGGGAVDLNCFNDYRLSRAVARFPIPVLTGIGHTTNISVVDEVAFADRITPTDAADFIIEKTRSFEEKLNLASQQLFEFYTASVEKEKNILTGSIELILRMVKERFQNENYKFGDYARQLRNGVNVLLKDYTNRLSSSVNELQHRSSMLISIRSQVIRQVYENKISRIPAELVNIQKLKLESLESTIRILDPVNVLKRGYSLTMKNGMFIRSAQMLKTGDLIKTRFYEGNIESEVK